MVVRFYKIESINMPNKLKYIRLNKSGKIVRVPNKSYRYPIQGIITECYNCKKRFIVQSYSNAKFCSRDCKYNYQSSNLIVIYCDNCGKEFKRKEHKIRYKYKFCSHKCFLLTSNRNYHGYFISEKSTVE